MLAILLGAFYGIDREWNLTWGGFDGVLGDKKNKSL